ncbi:MAG: hypothetical protein ACR2HK_00685 [Gemmatimonadales bacterium]
MSQPRTHLLVALTASMLLPACSRRDRTHEVAECVSLLRTTYIGGRIRDCLVNRHQWSPEEAERVEREQLRNVFPDSTAPADSAPKPSDALPDDSLSVSRPPDDQ